MIDTELSGGDSCSAGAHSASAGGMPRSMPYIIAAEFTERMSYYAIQAILVIFMTTRMLARDGTPDPMSESDAIAYYHWFVSISMFLPLVGALLADGIWGKYLTILSLSGMYVLGHAALALDETLVGLTIGLGLIAIGAGALKSCVPAMLGDQFTKEQEPMLPRVYSWYFWILNLGSFISTLSTPLLLENLGPRVAFGVPCLLMAASTIVFWLGRRRYVIVAPSGYAKLAQLFSWESVRELRVLGFVSLLIVPPVGVLYITNSAMVLQAVHLNLHWAGFNWLPAQVFVFNPLFSLAFIPLLPTIAYPAIERLVRLTPLRKIGAGFVFAMLGLLLLIWLQLRIDAGAHPSVGWHVLIIGIFIVSELLIHITVTEYACRVAPLRLRSVAMSFRPMTIAFGNAFIALTTTFVSSGSHGVAPGVAYYFFFLVIVAFSSVLYMMYCSRLSPADAAL